MKRSRLLIALAVVLFAAGIRIGWLDGGFAPTPPHHLVPYGLWVLLAVVPLLLTPLAPPSWLLWLATGWLVTLVVAGFVAATAGEVYPAWPYGGDVEEVHVGLFVSAAGSVLALAGIFWALGAETGPLPGHRFVVVLAAALVVAAVVPLYADLRGGAEEKRVQRQLARDNPSASKITVICRGEIGPGSPNCAHRIEDQGGSTTYGSFTLTK